MSIDMAQFHEVFFEESFEGLETMESELLNLDIGDADAEVVNTIFRAAHSIKGGSGTFGFDSIASFTHVMETLLDEMRDGRRGVERETVDLLLASVDRLRDMLEAARDGEPEDAAQVAETQAKLEAMLAGESAAADTATAVEPVDAEAATIPLSTGWLIRFAPFPHMLQTGNEPVRMLRELESLGSYSVEVDTSKLPAFESLDPEECFLAWDIRLEGDISCNDLDEIFDWVDGDCELEISPLDAPAEAEPVVEALAAAKTPAAPAPAEIPEASTAAVENPKEPERRQQNRRAAKPDRRGAKKEGGSIRVGTDKVDALINLVGELVITQSMLTHFGEDFKMSELEKLREGLQQLTANTRELQESVMQIRMLPISFSFQRFPRLVRDMSHKMGKKVELQLLGETTELDKTVLEKIGDPLVHLVRNSLDHGLETPEIRLAAGKSETGVLTLNAFHAGGNIVIEVSDDGAGLDRDRILGKARERGLVGVDEEISDERIYNLIFQAGFSTAAVVSDVSGRGVGMDVVRRNIKELGGHVDIRSTPGQGSTLSIRLPLTLAILDGQLVRVGSETYIISLLSVVQSLQIEMKDVSGIGGQAELYKLRDEYIPIIRLHESLGIEPEHRDLAHGLLVVVEAERRRIGLFVDELLGQQQVVIKSLEDNYQQIAGMAGATVLGDGTIALILDVPGIVNSWSEKSALENEVA